MNRSADPLAADPLAVDPPAGSAIPGEVLPAGGEIVLNAGEPRRTMVVTNTGDRPVQVGSHYHFAEVNPALRFDRARAMGWRLDVPSGGAVRFEPGQERAVTLVPLRGLRRAVGFRGAVMGDVPDGDGTGMDATDQNVGDGGTAMAGTQP